MGKNNEKPDAELNALVEGLRAIHSGDVAGGVDALRFAQDVQQQREEKESRDGKKKG